MPLKLKHDVSILEDYVFEPGLEFSTKKKKMKFENAFIYNKYCSNILKNKTFKFLSLSVFEIICNINNESNII